MTREGKEVEHRHEYRSLFLVYNQSTQTLHFILQLVIVLRLGGQHSTGSFALSNSLNHSN